MSNQNNKTGLNPELIKQAQDAYLEYARKVEDGSGKILDLTRDIYDLEEKISRSRGANKKALQDNLKIKEKELKTTQALTEANEELSDGFKAQNDAYNNILDAKLEAESIDKNIARLMQKQEKLAASGNTEAANALDIVISQQLAYKAQLPYLQSVQSTFKQINDIAQDLASSITGAFDNLPGGKYLSKALGLDKLGDAFKTSITAAGKAFITSGGSITAATSAFSSSFMALLNPVTLVAAALAGIFLVMSNITKQAKDFSNQTGLTVAASQRLVEQSISLQTSSKNQLSSQKDILAVQQEIVSQLGPMAQLSGEVALQVSETGNAFGYGAEEAAKVQAQMMQINGMSEQAAANAQDFTAQLALSEGVAPGAVMKDIAKSAGVANKYFFGNTKALGKAAVEAQKMGMSLEDMAKTSESLLNIEESLTNQYQLSAMIGRQVNLDKARQLAAEGKIAEAAKETLKQLGGIQEFEKASTFEKERMAAAAGMSVEQLGKSFAIQEKMTNATEEELAAMNGLNLSIADIKNMSAEELKDKLASQQATEQMSASFEKIKNELVSGIMPIAKGLIPVFNVIVGLVNLILWPFTKLREMATAIGETLGGWAQALGPFGIILKTIAGIGIVLAAYGAFLSLSYIPVIGAALGTIAAAAVMTAGFTALNSVGDLAMPAAGDGPIVASPSEGTIFQGTKNDEVAMGPGVIGSAAGNNGGTATSVNVSIDYDKLATAVANAIQNVKIIIDESAVNAIAQKGAVRASFK